MARQAHLTTVVALCAAGALLLAIAEAAAVQYSDENFANTKIKEGDDELDVADPYGDPNESDSLQQDSTAEWQLEMVKGLYAQRKAEKEFIQKLEEGGEGMNAMVTNITTAFKKLEELRQQRGSKLIKQHFDNEIKLLKNSSQKILKNLESILAAKSSDSAAIKSVKAKASALFSKAFSQQLQDESTLFKKQMQQIAQEHINQKAKVQELFTLLKQWKETFHGGLEKAEARLETIAQKWDLL